MSKKTQSFIKGYKFRIYPTDEQKEYLAKIFGCTRFVYNKALAKSIEDYNNYKNNPDIFQKPNVSAFGLCYNLVNWKQSEETSWLSDVPSHVLQMSLHNLANAFTRLFKTKKGYPQFKNKHDKQSATFTRVSYTLKDNVFKIAKCKDPINIRWSRELPSGEIGPCTISKTSSGKYFVSFMCEYIPEKTHGKDFIGIDAGITDLATISTGEIIINPRYFTRAQKQLAKYQRRLSKKNKGSSNRTKAKIKVARHHEHIANQRLDYVHKFTTRLIRENQAIAIENLNISNMVRNHKLSKHIMDAGWGIMRKQLTYKAIASQHCKLIIADPYYPSTQLCHVCGRKSDIRIKLGVTKWQCSYCSTIHGRDDNASKNLEQLARSNYKFASQNKIAGQIILANSYIN
jgi:putative transposase